MPLPIKRIRERFIRGVHGAVVGMLANFRNGWRIWNTQTTGVVVISMPNLLSMAVTKTFGVPEWGVEGFLNRGLAVRTGTQASVNGGVEDFPGWGRGFRVVGLHFGSCLHRGLSPSLQLGAKMSETTNRKRNRKCSKTPKIPNAFH